ncbi:MAG TPA: choice-of-anchor tandem repeat GloVer-containing protein [Verrucomicrobiae bacterium]
MISASGWMANAQTNYQTLREFGFPEELGNTPLSLSTDTNGALFGTTEKGGTNDTGVVFTLNRDGSGYTVLRSFTGSVLAYGRLLTASDGALYGTTYQGNTNGTVFKINKDGSGYMELRSFGGSGDARLPRAGVIEASNGLLYGMTQFGGTNNAGAVFRMEKNGSNYSVIKSFLTNGLEGTQPLAELVEASGGLLFSVASAGGDEGQGAVFNLDANGMNSTPLWSFSLFGNDGRVPTALIRASDNVLYGVTRLGGVSNVGTVFHIGQDGLNYGTIWHFTGGTNGGAPVARLVEGADGFLYGATTNGGSNGLGVIFRLARNGSSYSAIHHFSSAAGEGTNRTDALLTASDGRLYGASRDGGQTNRGVIFGLDTTGANFSAVRSFRLISTDGSSPAGKLCEGSDGMLYGMTTTGGVSDRGTVFRIQRDGSNYMILHHFTGAPDGASPLGSLIEASDGKLYGTTTVGGTNNTGTIFRINKEGSSYTAVWSFLSATGAAANPQAGVVEAPDGILYGVALSIGGAFPPPTGRAFKLNKDGTGYSEFYKWPTNAGLRETPRVLILGSDGFLYGHELFFSGVATYSNIVFKLSVDGSMRSNLFSVFTTTLPGPASLVEGSDGVLYGAYADGLGAGDLFKVNRDGTGGTTLASFNPNPLLYGYVGGVERSVDGAVYAGVPNQSSMAARSAAIRFNPATSTSQTLNVFDSGGRLHDTLLLGSDGAFYGTSKAGGALNQGVLFVIRTPPFAPVVPRNISAVTGEQIILDANAGGVAPIAYQWFFNGVLIGGATNSTLVFGRADFTNAGDYRFVASNSFGSVTSGPAALWFLEQQAYNRLALYAASGRQFQFQYSTNLGGVNSWFLLNKFTITNSPHSYTDPGTIGDFRFYRALQLQ